VTTSYTQKGGGIFLTGPVGTGVAPESFIAPKNRAGTRDRGWLWGFVPSAVDGASTATVSGGQALDGTNALVMAHDPALSISPLTVGAGGVDVGPVTADTFYYVHVIYGAGPGVSALMSRSATAPTLPAGYTLFRRVGTLLTDTTTTFVGLQVVGNQNERWHCYDGSNPALALGAVPVTVTSYTLAAVVPPTLQRLRFSALVTNTGSSLYPALKFGGRGAVLDYTLVQPNIPTTSVDVGNLEIAVAQATPPQLYAQSSDVHNDVVVYPAAWLEVL
jgi:hypothetical protein